MSRENVEVMRRIYDEWGRGNFRAGGEMYDPHVVFVMGPGFPETGAAYLGPERIALYMRRDFLASYAEIKIEGEQFLDAGDSVVVAVRQVGTGRESGAVTELRYFQVWTFRGKAIIRVESIRHREEALEAVGLRE